MFFTENPIAGMWMFRDPASLYGTAIAVLLSGIFLDSIPCALGQTSTRRIDEAVGVSPTIKNIQYGDHPRNLLDFFVAESTSPTPLFIYFHGGGFVSGDKRDVVKRQIIKDCLASGISVVSANYRFVAGPDGEPFPGPLMDGVRVVQFVRSQATKLNLDPERVVLSGSSAGALMALWIAVHADFADPKSDDPAGRESSRVRGVVAYSGPTTVDPHEIIEHVGGNPRIHPAMFPIFDIKKIEELDLPAMRRKVEEYSPLHHVSRDDPPLQLRYRGILSSAPLPPETDFRISIHHPKFGEMMRDKYEAVGSKQSVELVCSDCPDTAASEIEFLRRVLDLDTANK